MQRWMARHLRTSFDVWVLEDAGVVLVSTSNLERSISVVLDYSEMVRVLIVHDDEVETMNVHGHDHDRNYYMVMMEMCCLL